MLLEKFGCMIRGAVTLSVYTSGGVAGGNGVRDSEQVPPCLGNLASER
jgi:hypothetical protein